MLRCKTASSAFLDSAIVAGTLHHGDLWGCPLVYSTTIAPFQRATWRASLSRADTLCTNELCTGSGTACHVTMCPFAFTVDDSHTEATSKLEMYAY